MELGMMALPQQPMARPMEMERLNRIVRSRPERRRTHRMPARTIARHWAAGTGTAASAGQSDEHNITGDDGVLSDQAQGRGVSRRPVGW